MLYVIRHGQVDTNVKNQVNGWNEEELNKTGIEQAKKAGEKLKNIKIDMVFCSPLIRTKQTYNYLNLDNTIPIFYDDRIKERNSNSMVYASVESIDNNIWYDKSKIIIYENTEGFRNIIDRIKEMLEEIKEKYSNKNVLLITHGDVCKAIYLYFNPNIKDISNFHQNNCEVMEYEY